MGVDLCYTSVVVEVEAVVDIVLVLEDEEGFVEVEKFRQAGRNEIVLEAQVVVVVGTEVWVRQVVGLAEAVEVLVVVEQESWRAFAVSRNNGVKFCRNGEITRD